MVLSWRSVRVQLSTLRDSTDRSRDQCLTVIYNKKQQQALAHHQVLSLTECICQTNSRSINGHKWFVTRNLVQYYVSMVAYVLPVYYGFLSSHNVSRLNSLFIKSQMFNTTLAFAADSQLSRQHLPSSHAQLFIPPQSQASHPRTPLEQLNSTTTSLNEFTCFKKTDTKIKNIMKLSHYKKQRTMCTTC